MKKQPITLSLLIATLIGFSSLNVMAKPVIKMKCKTNTSKQEERQEEDKVDKDGKDYVVTTDTETKCCNVDVTIAAKGEVGKCKLHWCVIGEDLKTEEKVTTCHGEKEIQLTPGKSITETLECAVKSITVDSTAKNAKKTYSGHDMLGYLVILTSDGEMVGCASNSSRWRKDKWVMACMNPPKAKKKGKKKK